MKTIIKQVHPARADQFFALILHRLIHTKPKHYSAIVQKNTKYTKLLSWIKCKSLINSSHFPELCYSAIYQDDGVCQYNNQKHVKKFTLGFQGCGPASSCKCTSDTITASMKSYRNTISHTDQTAINTKRSETLMNRYGVMHNTQRESVKALLSRPKIPIDTHDKLTSYNWLHTEYVTNERNASDIARELGVYYSTVIFYCKSHGFEIRQQTNYSLIELDVNAYVNSLGFETLRNCRDLLGDGREIDIFVPESKFGIEVNGLYWHSNIEDKNYHRTKSIAAIANGFELFHITDYEWNNKQSIIKSMIKSKLGITDKLFARKCKLVTLDSHAVRNFFDDSHLNGFISGTLYVGLLHNNELVSAMIFGNDRFGKSTSLELLRFASKLDTTVIGGGSKMLKYVGKPVISYCDASKSTGNGYKSMGFTFVKHTDAGYFWTDGTVQISRFKCQKHQLKRWLPGYDDSLSETDNMTLAGYRRYWDCGNYLFHFS